MERWAFSCTILINAKSISDYSFSQPNKLAIASSGHLKICHIELLNRELYYRQFNIYTSHGKILTTIKMSHVQILTTNSAVGKLTFIPGKLKKHTSKYPSLLDPTIYNVLKSGLAIFLVSDADILAGWTHDLAILSSAEG